MANISKLNGYDIKDAVARNTIDTKVFNNPVGVPGANIVNVFNQFIANTPISGDNAFKALQGAVCIPEDNRYIIAFSNGPDYTQAILVSMDEQFNVISRSAPLNVGHCGDMTYNPNNQTIYCSIGTAGTYAKKIAMINKNTMAVTGYIDSPTERAVKLISYDDINNVYYIEDDIHIIKCDEAFNVLSIDDLLINYEGLGTDGHQSSFCYNGSFYILYNNNINGAYNTFYVLRIENGEVNARLSIPSPSSTFEIEGAIIDGNTAYLTFGQSWLSIYKIDLSGRNLDDTVPTLNDGMIQLNSGDLDSLTIGDYIIRDATGASAVANTPIDNYGMRIKCFFMANFMYQIAETLDMYTYIRRRSGDTWASWHNVSGRTVALTPTYGADMGNHYGVQVFQHGGAVTVSGLFNATYPATTWVTIMTLPVKPSAIVHACGISTAPTPQPVQIRVQTNGEIQAYAPSTANEVRMNITFAVD